MEIRPTSGVACTTEVGRNSDCGLQYNSAMSSKQGYARDSLPWSFPEAVENSHHEAAAWLRHAAASW